MFIPEKAEEEINATADQELWGWRFGAYRERGIMVIASFNDD
jgi:hypothetical protein